MQLGVWFLSVSASCEHGSEGSEKFGNISIALNPPPNQQGDVLHGVVWFRDSELEVVDSPEVLVHVCYSMWYHID